jgi:23S rRNA (uridine2552-2'-O)-methyltransferase
MPVNVNVMLQDAFAWDYDQPFLKGKFDVVMSDMAPSTTGRKDDDHEGSVLLCERALEIACKALKPSSRATLIIKLFDGGRSQGLRKRLKHYFEKVTIIVPPATRSGSAEAFLIGRGFSGEAYTQPPEEGDES